MVGGPRLRLPLVGLRMSEYEKGRRAEYEVRDHLQAHGYAVIRSAGSKGIADLVAFRRGFVLFVQVKRVDEPLTPAERAALLGLADHLGSHIAVPLLALRLPRQRNIFYRVLTGPGPGDLLDWEPHLATGRGLPKPRPGQS